MSIQYSGGTLVNQTFLQSAGTRAELADDIKTQLVAAGWTSVTNATSDYTLTSATTPYGLAVKLRVFDPGTGNCTQLRMSDGTGARTQAGSLFLLPAASKTWRVVASKYQFFVMTAPVSAAREFACGGVPYVPPFLTSVTAAGWCHGNAETDIIATVRDSFRTLLSTDKAAGTSGNMWAVWNSSTCEVNGTGVVNTTGAQRLVASVGASSVGLATDYRWADGTFHSYEPLIGWGLTGTADEGQVRGQLWDAAVSADSVAGDTLQTIDGHSCIAITHSNAGTAASFARGTLFHAVT